MSDDEEEDKFVSAMRLGATDKWCLVRSYSELANAPPEGIRAVTSMEELKVVLGHENKTAHPLLTRLRMHPYSNYIEVLEHPELDTDHKKINMAELALLVKHQGPIQLSDYIFRNNV